MCQYPDQTQSIQPEKRACFCKCQTDGSTKVLFQHTLNNGLLTPSCYTTQVGSTWSYLVVMQHKRNAAETTL